MADYKPHPIAEMFPPMDDRALAELAQDIRDHGLQEKIRLWEGMILDGWNRYRACKLAKVEPEFKAMTWRVDEVDKAIAYVMSRNLKRRHLSIAQQAGFAGKIARVKEGRPKHGTDAELNQAQAAKLLDVSVSSIGYHRAIAEKAPDLLPAVETGLIGMKEAAEEARHPEFLEDDPAAGLRSAAR